MPTGGGGESSTTVHHVEQNVGINGCRATHVRREAATAKHVSWVHEVVTIVVCGTLPASIVR